MGHRKKGHQTSLERARLTKASPSSEPDLHIIRALDSLPKEMRNAKGVLVVLSPKRRRDGLTTKEHIAAKRHGLKESDIAIIPVILLDPKSIRGDKKRSRHTNYYGKRKKASDRRAYLKIVTERQGSIEEIDTVFPIPSGKVPK